ncbi:uncharacterized protein [Dendrobates tinctorius]|uniref:uncharacterized protein n=1 Tax=Dendrobates tinctorius TaxID=92724 RepID=UPI003CC9E85A
MILKWKKFGTTRSLPRSGCRAKLSNRGKRALVRENPMITVTELHRCSREMGKSSAKSTSTAALHQSSLYGRVARRKPLLSARHMKAHIEFAKKHMNDSQTVLPFLCSKIILRAVPAIARPPSPSSPPSRSAPTTAPPSPGDQRVTPPTPSPVAIPSPASLSDIGAASPSAVGATGSGWAISPSPDGTERPQYHIPTAQALLAAHRRMRAAMAVTLAAMDVHGQMLERYLAGQQQGGSP